MWPYNVRTMLTTHTLAQNIITGHNTPNPILDASELSLLHRFVLDPTSKSKLSLLESAGMLSYLSPSAPAPQSLIGYCIARSSTPDPAFDESEISLLKKWFQSLDVDISNGAGPMIASHTLGYNIMQRPHEILDAKAFALLRRFCLNPEDKEEMLREWDMVDEKGAEPGTRANGEKGSLIGVVVARWGTGKSVFGKEEVGLLREWFEKGGPGSVGGEGEVVELGKL